MSADNWAFCPRCKSLANRKDTEARAAVDAAYGKVAPEEFLDMLAKSKIPAALEETFREDYAIGITTDGEFMVSYTGRCTVCGLSHRFRHEEKMAGI